MRIPVVALDHGSTADLCARPFSVLENGTRQFIESCGADTRPLTIGILVDASGSMRQHAALVRETLTAILGPDSAKSKYSLFLSGVNLQRVVPPPGFRGSLVDLLTAVERRGRTAIIDHLKETALELSKNPGTRRLLVLLSDGDDNLSDVSDKKLVESLQRTRVTLLYLLLFSPRDTVQGQLRTSRIMIDLPDGTGGVLLPVRDSKDSARATQTLSSIISAASLISYYSSNPSLDGSLRRIKIESRKGSGLPKLQLCYPQGYYAPSQ